ncbi:MAG: quinolinate synthase NadA [Candidatus Gracilibacteria bacterium]|jgi:quinolinate synthase
MDQKTIIKRIKELKKKKNAIILVHNYQIPEIYEVADFMGDSLKLCLEAARTKARMIVFCGVNFMAESAAILNPGKKVVVPHIDAGCSMADMVDIDEVKKLQKKYPKAKTVCYINSTADVKAISDIVCTSANAVKVIKSLKAKQIIFVPDKNLAAYVAKEVPEKEIIAYDAFCPAHHAITKEDLKDIIKTYPKASIIAHPECRPEVLKLANHITSTEGMIKAAREDKAKDFFILTECGMTERLKKELPGKSFQGLCNICFDMKKNTPELILKALETEKPEIKVDREIGLKAKKAFDRMFAVK